jgi:DUF2075 family protein
MTVYLETKVAFMQDVFHGILTEKLIAAFKSTFGRSVSPSEVRSWNNSLEAMFKVLGTEALPENAGVAIEFNIPQTAKRVDFIVTGADSDGRPSAVIIELKQWDKVESTAKDAIVRTFLNASNREVSHPSYQAWSYAALLEDFNAVVQRDQVRLSPCAYLHNCRQPNGILDVFYEAHLANAPAFLQKDAEKLRQFITERVVTGDAGSLVTRLRNSETQAAKALADAIGGMLEGKREFVMIDDQKLVFETAMGLARKAAKSKKQVLIVDGGPGTGKSVVAINLLSSLLRNGTAARYVTKNAAPRAVFQARLSGGMEKGRISHLFAGSGDFLSSGPNQYGALIVDEAHRLNEKSGLYRNLGENQVMELIRAARFTVFFIDEDQRVTLHDIGTKAQIRKWAELEGAEVEELSLESQFRCSGSDGYLAWLDSTLQIRATANLTLQGSGYDFRVMPGPVDLHRTIIDLNGSGTQARVVAGYCWNWVSKKSPSKIDIDIPEHDYTARWNLDSDGSLWIDKKDSVTEVGCIHTCQGLETDYIGVIIGPDLVVRDGSVITRPEFRAPSDASIKGIKALARKDPGRAAAMADVIIKNTYRTLMTRGRKGCFVWSVDGETQEYLLERSRAQP